MTTPETSVETSTPGGGDQGKTTTEPEKTTTEPGKTTTEPGKTTTEPGKTTTEPGKTTTKPGGTDEPCKEIPGLPEGAKGCVTPDDIEFDFDFSYCQDAELMSFEIQIEGVNSIQVVTVDVDGKEYPETVSINYSY